MNLGPNTSRVHHQRSTAQKGDSNMSSTQCVWCMGCMVAGGLLMPGAGNSSTNSFWASSPANSSTSAKYFCNTMMGKPCQQGSVSARGHETMRPRGHETTQPGARKKSRCVALHGHLGCRSDRSPRAHDSLQARMPLPPPPRALTLTAVWPEISGTSSSPSVFTIRASRASWHDSSSDSLHVRAHNNEQSMDTDQVSQQSALKKSSLKQ